MILEQKTFQVSEDFADMFFYYALKAKKEIDEKRHERINRKEESMILIEKSDYLDKIKQKIDKPNPNIETINKERLKQLSIESEKLKQFEEILVPIPPTPRLEIPIPRPIKQEYVSYDEIQHPLKEMNEELDIPQKNIPHNQLKVPIPSNLIREITPQKRAISAVFGKINRFILNDEVSTIQCDGPNISVKILREGKMIDTSIFLDQEEIDSIINKFAQQLGIQIAKPVFKATLENLNLVAISSEYSGSRFVITKI